MADLHTKERTLEREIAPAVEIINRRQVRIEKMVTHVFPLEQADEALRFFMAQPDQAVRVAIKP